MKMRRHRRKESADLICDQDRLEEAASAGAKAEAKGTPFRRNPYRHAAPLREAWGAGWRISRDDKLRGKWPKRLTEAR